MRGGRQQREAEQQPRGGGGGGQHVVPAADSAPLSTEPGQGGGDQTPAGLRTPVTGPATGTGFWLRWRQDEILGSILSDHHLYTHGTCDTRHNMYIVHIWYAIMDSHLV